MNKKIDDFGLMIYGSLIIISLIILLLFVILIYNWLNGHWSWMFYLFAVVIITFHCLRIRTPNEPIKVIVNERKKG